MEEQKVDYNAEPVHYCSNCLYLGNPNEITLLDTKVEFCPYCGSTDFEESNIKDWESKFETKYKQGKFLKLRKPWRQIMEDNLDSLVEKTSQLLD